MIAMVEVADINNAYGNPVAELVQTACRFDSHITVSNDGKYIMGMMAFGLKKGMQVEISADGADETQAVETIKNFLACK